MLGLEDAECKGACYPLPIEQNELFQEMRRALALLAYQKQGLPLALEMEIRSEGCIQMGGGTERDVSEFDAGYYGTRLDKAWEEASYVLKDEIIITCGSLIHRTYPISLVIG
jgi:hypothetical protein